MSLSLVNSINAYALILLSGYRYFSAHTPNTSSLVPIFFAVMLLITNNGLEYNSRPMRTMAFGLTILVVIGLAYQTFVQKGYYHDSDRYALYLMLLLSSLSILRFIYYYITKK